MFGTFHLRGLLMGAAALLAPALAHAAPTPPDRNATGSVDIVSPASVRKLQDLNFAYVTVTAAGTAVIDPNTGAMTTTGGVIHAGGLPYPAQFEAVSPTKTVVHIRIPKQPITLTRSGGTETMTVSNWTLQGSESRQVVAKEPFAFNVGGTLNVGANQVEGLYEGSFTVDIQYN